MNASGFSHASKKPPIPGKDLLFGEQVPFGDPLWYQGGHSPYITTSHIEWRAKCREFVEAEIMPHVDEWEEQALVDYPAVAKQQAVLLRKMYDAGFLSSVFPAEFGGTPPIGFDIFHELVQLDEFGRIGSWGIVMAAQILTMAMPPLLLAAQPSVRAKAEQCIRAEKQIALCISEPWAGSDVANIRTTAVRNGDHYTLNGEKKWITNGVNADYFTVVCRTGKEGSGSRGISLLFVERGVGVSTDRMKLQGNWTAGTAFVRFEDVRVPIENLIGEENQGFKLVMLNFNHERFVICAQGTRAARVLLEDCVKYAKKRKTFGKYLIEHQVIKHKIGEMARHVEATQAFLESVAYQMQTGAPVDKVGQLTALLKVQMSRTYKFCATEASQIFGGSSYVRGGQGARVERAMREVVSAAVPGGSEEIMLDLAMKLAKL